MAWINANDFYNRSLLNDLVSLRALRTATAVLLVQHGDTVEDSAALRDIDDAIAATEAVIRSVAHHG